MFPSVITLATLKAIHALTRHAVAPKKVAGYAKKSHQKAQRDAATHSNVRFATLGAMVNRVQSKALLHAQLAGVFQARGFAGATLNELAAAAGLGKASLYHHFPGGKAEMAAVLLRDAVARLEKGAFARLNGSQPPQERLQRFVDGFSDYVDGGESHCFIAVLAQGSIAKAHKKLIAQQYDDWLHHLASVFEQAGEKPKRAERVAAKLLADLYGFLLVAKLRSDSKYFRQGIKRLKKELA